MRRSTFVLSRCLVAFCLINAAMLLAGRTVEGQRVEVDISGVDASASTSARIDGDVLVVRWTLSRETSGRALISLARMGPLIRELAIVVPGGEARSIVEDADPVFALTVGSRDSRKGWNTFFDKTHRRPYSKSVAELHRERVRVEHRSSRLVVTISELRCASFRGNLVLTFFPNASFFLTEAVVTTEEPWRAVLYDGGIVSPRPRYLRTSWVTTEGSLHREPFDRRKPAQAYTARHRVIVGETAVGSIAVFPPPHQFFDPLDDSYNLAFVWKGRAFSGTSLPFGLGVRHEPRGDDRFVPWFNAPPGTKQRLRFLVALHPGGARQTIDEVLRYTRGDRFAKLPGHRTFTSHYHIEHSMNVIHRRARGEDTSEVPEFVDVFREMGVDIVHLGEFHLDGHPRDRGAKRLAELAVMHEECRRLSNQDFLLLPGEEPNVHFGGHWMSFFPRPVYWILAREKEEPFVENHAKYGKVYRVGSAADVERLLQAEGGLAWTAHARVKSSRGYPDRYRDRDFYLSDRFLGAAWKAMPADLSRPRLGERALDLLDDMANWGQEKYLIGEVDVFEIDRTHELWGHMNINYLRLDELPKFENGWSAVVAALRRGAFFVTTGEVLIPRFRVGGRESGESFVPRDPSKVSLEAELRWTFPLERAEVVIGDGRSVMRTSVDLSATEPFGSKTLRLELDLRGKRWVRLEVWDCVTNGAFTQPVWCVGR